MPVAKAVLTHFLLSAVIVSVILACIFFVWYPSPLFEINGATDILKILVGVDLVLGPLLTSGASDGQQPVGHGFGLDRMLHQFGDNGLAQLCYPITERFGTVRLAM